MKSILNPAQDRYLNYFKKTDDPLVAEMEEYAGEHNVPILSWQSADFLEILIKMLKPKRVLEIGTAIAYSSIRIARNLKKKAVLHELHATNKNKVPWPWSHFPLNHSCGETSPLLHSVWQSLLDTFTSSSSGPSRRPW